MKTIILLSLLIGGFANAEVLKCVGTEPFWSLKYNSNTTRIVYDDPEHLDGVVYEAISDEASRNHLGRRLVQATNGLSFWLLKQEEGTACSDGMSDAEYDYEIVINQGGLPLVGCCNARPGTTE